MITITTTGDHHKGGFLVTLIRSHPLENLDARHLRHLPVTQDEINFTLIHHSHGLTTIDRFINLTARVGIPDCFFYQVADERCIINDQNPQFHRASALE